MTSDHGSETGRQNIPAAGSAHTNEYMNGAAAGAAPHRASPSDMNRSDNGEDRRKSAPMHERRATSSPSEAARTDYAHARSSDTHRAPYGSFRILPWSSNCKCPQSLGVPNLR